MKPLRCLLAGLAWTLAGAVSAQGAGSSAAHPGTDSSGLERAQRLAASPLRMIQEAARAPQRPAVDAAVRPGAALAPASEPLHRAADSTQVPDGAAARAGRAIARLPSHLGGPGPASARLASLASAPAPLPPIALDPLRSLPWPSEPIAGAVEPTEPRHLAGAAAGPAGTAAQQIAQAEPAARP